MTSFTIQQPGEMGGENLEWAIETTKDVRIDSPDKTPDEMMELFESMVTEGQTLPDLPDMTDMADLEVSTTETGTTDTVHAYTLDSEGQLDPIWNGADMSWNDAQDNIPILNFDEVDVSSYMDTKSLAHNENEQSVSNDLPTTQTVFRSTGNIDYSIKQVLRQVKRSYLVAFKPNPFTGARRRHKWLPESRAYQIPQDLVLDFNRRKMHWYRGELRRPGKNPKPTDFEAYEVAD